MTVTDCGSRPDTSPRIDSTALGRREFLKLTSAGMALFSGTCRSSADPPNIVFILADDLGYHQLGCYGNPYYQTPHIDQLASEGMRFSDAYASPVCSPTRAALMTGKYPARLHLTDYIAGNDPRDRKLLTPNWTKYLPMAETTISEVLKQQGYTTGHFGKWHLNKDKEYQPGRPGDPGSQGFDEVLTTVKPEEDADPLKDAHHVKAITDAAVDFIRRHAAGSPFFCYISHNSIHRPQMEDPEIVERYRNRPGSDGERNKPVAAAMVEVLDKSVGRILQTLADLDLGENTLVVFYSDNGALGDPEVLKPLRGSKANLFEGGIRVPLVIRWPGHVRPGSISNQVCLHIDLFATLADLSGTNLKEMQVDGVSLLPVLFDEATLERDAIYWHYPHYHHRGIAPSGAIRLKDYKLIEWFENSIDGIDVQGSLELYNLRLDPGEQDNRAGEMPELAAKLYQRLRQWRREVGAQEMSRNPAFGE